MNGGDKSRADPERLALWLGPESPLARELKGFAPRPGQLDMALAVARALAQETPLLVEAGTGTGKTLAYLLPALMSGLKLVVSTGTRTLQDQISSKELPLLKRSLAPQLRWAVLKGRANYLCRRRFDALARQPDLALPGVAGALAILRPWSRATQGGDLDEVRGQGLSQALIGEITSNGEQCLGGRCPQREDCFLLEARRRAAEADLVVVNHHLFLADLALKAAGHGEALPRYQGVVFDEAHQVPEVATQVFGVSVSSQRLAVLLKDVGREVPRAALLPPLSACQAAGERLFASLGRLAGPQGGSLGLTPAFLKQLAAPGQALRQALEGLAEALGKSEEEEVLAGRAQTLALDLASVALPVPGQSVAWAQTRGRGASLNLSPVEVGPHLEHALYQHLGRLVFTSATLAPLGDLEPLRQRLGLPAETAKLVKASPFDLASQALLYVPRQMPPPQAPGFAQAVARQLEDILSLSQGRAFVLFTTHRNLELVSGLLNGRLPYTCLVQGQAPRMELLKRFVEQSPCVLFATASFWQGVDVPGPALSAVIVDKLPFAPPDDPLLAARVQRLEQEGQSGFHGLMLPEAILSLKQGLGRLLRTPTDRGLLAVLDVRLTSQGYGRRFLKALAPVPLTHDLDQVRRFFAAEEKEHPGRTAA
ncbi:MAG: ATP-dependent DNA helicase [Desulfarculus sp.]|nr:ATP-dependent DNA helicase [Desulfarculus sp.]